MVATQTPTSPPGPGSWRPLEISSVNGLWGAQAAACCVWPPACSDDLVIPTRRAPKIPGQLSPGPLAAQGPRLGQREACSRAESCRRSAGPRGHGGFFWPVARVGGLSVLGDDGGGALTPPPVTHETTGVAVLDGSAGSRGAPAGPPRHGWAWLRAVASAPGSLASRDSPMSSNQFLVPAPACEGCPA